MTIKDLDRWESLEIVYGIRNGDGSSYNRGVP